MSLLTSPETATKCKQKWITLHQEDKDTACGSVYLDDSLTNLQWLQDFSILSATLERPISSGGWQPQQPRLQASDSPASPPAGDTAATGMPPSLGSPFTSSASANGSQQVDYRSNPRVKPPYSYATLICMAMQASKKTKITLSAIYSWITENFCYYRHAEPSWQNSIRHNLSLNKCFMKVPRQKDEPGKGGFWMIDPQYADMFVDGVFRRRRMPSTHSRGFPYQVHNQTKRKEPPRCSPSPLLASHEKDSTEFDWTSSLDDVLDGKGSNFEDLDINVALSSLSCEVDMAGPGRGKWCVGGGAELACGYVEDLQQQHQHQHQELTLFPEPPHPWEELKEELKEEPVAAPLALDNPFGFCEGFFVEIQPWERAESFL